MTAAVWLLTSGGTQQYTLDDVLAISSVVHVWVARTADLVGATSDGDPVSQWNDAQGSEDLSRVGASGMTYETDGTYEWVESDGSTYFNAATSLTSPFFFAAAGRQLTSSGTFHMVSMGRRTIVNRNNTVRINRTATTGTRVQDGGPASFAGLNPTPDDASDYVVSGQGQSEDFVPRVNGTAYSGTSDLFDGGSGDEDIRLFGTASSGNETASSSRLYGAVVCNAIPSASEIDTIEGWLAQLAGVTLA